MHHFFCLSLSLHRTSLSLTKISILSLQLRSVFGYWTPILCIKCYTAAWGGKSTFACRMDGIHLIPTVTFLWQYFRMSLWPLVGGLPGNHFRQCAVHFYTIRYYIWKTLYAVEIGLPTNAFTSLLYRIAESILLNPNWKKQRESLLSFIHQEKDLKEKPPILGSKKKKELHLGPFNFCYNYRMDVQTSTRPHKAKVHSLLSVSGCVISVAHSIVPWPSVRNHSWFNGTRLSAASYVSPSRLPHSHCLGQLLPCQLYRLLSPARHV